MTDNAVLQQKLQAAERLLAARRARDSLIAFTRFTMPDPDEPDNVEASIYSVQAHHRVLAEALEKAENGMLLAEGHNILCISVGPQKGKSELVSRRFPAWMEGRRPTRNFMLGAYNDDFAREFGDDVRNVMSTKEYAQVFPKVRLRKGSKSKDHMITEHGGKMSFFGRGGSATGRPADIFIIDDPIKNQEEAASLTIRNTVWNWFTKVVQTRCHGQSVIIIVMTRWHEDDLIGRLTDKTSTYYDEEMAKKVMYINLPSIVEDAALAKALGVPVGGSIWEERFPLEMLKLRMRIDPSGFNAMEMGRPTPPEGSFYKVHQIRACRYKSLDELPRNLRKYGAGDLAVSDATKADSSVVGDWGLDEHDVLWLLPDLYWEKKKADESVDKLVSMGKDNWMTFFGEKGQIARAIGPFLEKRMQEESAYFHIETFPNVNKGQAALSFRGRLAQRKVRFPAFAEWWPRAEEQMLKFTGSGDDKEDDFVDMCSRIGQGIPMQVSASRQKKPEDNVIRIGSMAWIKNQHKHQERRKKRRAAVMGM